MRTLIVTLAAAAATVAMAPAAAQAIKPGLWEIQHRMGGNPKMDQLTADMQKHMREMTPEQRQQMESAMAGRDMPWAPASAGGGMAMRMCLTREMVERNEFPSGRADCKSTQQKRTGKTVKSTFTCTNPPSSGENEVTIDGPESYASRGRITRTVGGNPETMTIETRGKWLSADCGNVKPLQAR